jgi:Tol biopolymer transport system component/predicted Ser/Thr protein kinase
MDISGRSLLHYRLLEKIGEGGMGSVYRAEDTHLDRVVAVKVLPPEKTADAERKKRFVQEAKAASSLNHPNIVVIHDIASDGGVDFIVMEYVQGKTLDHLIGRKGLRLNEALNYAVQIADGLARAHAAGIVHRDLKPTNVMVTPDDRVKILDFGLAKLTENVSAVTAGPTMTLGRAEKPLTEEGYILGTVDYMSPEQAEGRTVDSRSDVFSFGSVFYEMLTGAKAFHRETGMATLAAILKEEPKPASQLHEAFPPEIEPVIVRCLRKDPQRRWQNMSDLKVVLQDLKEDSESGKLRAPMDAQSAARRRGPRPIFWIGFAVAIVVAAVLLSLLFQGRRAGPPEYDITRLTFDSGTSWAPAVNPEGTMFAFASDRSEDANQDIWIQQISGGPPLRRTTHPAIDGFPSFSPDGSRIVFQSARDGGGIYEIPTLGGSERKLADHGHLPRYSPDGSKIVFLRIPASLDERLVTMSLLPAQGGTPVPFLPEFCIVSLSVSPAPVWSPDGKYLLFNGRRIDDPSSLDWWVAPVSGGPPIRTGAHSRLTLNPNWQVPYAWADNYVYYATGTTVEGVNIYRVPVDPGTFKIEGPAERITSGAGMQYHCSVLKDGRILYSNISWLANIWTIAADPDAGRVEETFTPVSQDAMAKFSFDLSRDGSKIVFNAFGGLRQRRFEVHWKDLAGGEEKTFEMKAINFGQNPRISPDGSVFSYRDAIEGKSRTFFVNGRDGSPREGCGACAILAFYDDPNFALVRDGDRRLARQNLSTGERTSVLETEAGVIGEVALSTDDRWAAFILEKPDGGETLFVAPLGAGPTARKDWSLLVDGENYVGSPAWSPDGRLLYYLAEQDGTCSVWIQALDRASKKAVGPARNVLRPRLNPLEFNNPKGNARMAVARDKLAIWRGISTGNIYMAKPKGK